jgi:hypothetical protein
VSRLKVSGQPAAVLKPADPKLPFRPSHPRRKCVVLRRVRPTSKRTPKSAPRGAAPVPGNAAHEASFSLEPPVSLEVVTQGASLPPSVPTSRSTSSTFKGAADPTGLVGSRSTKSPTSTWVASNERRCRSCSTMEPVTATCSRQSSFFQSYRPLFPLDGAPFAPKGARTERDGARPSAQDSRRPELRLRVHASVQPLHTTRVLDRNTPWASNELSLWH